MSLDGGRADDDEYAHEAKASQQSLPQYELLVKPSGTLRLGIPAAACGPAVFAAIAADFALALRAGKVTQQARVQHQQGEQDEQLASKVQEFDITDKEDTDTSCSPSGLAADEVRTSDRQVWPADLLSLAVEKNPLPCLSEQRGPAVNTPPTEATIASTAGLVKGPGPPQEASLESPVMDGYSPVSSCRDSEATAGFVKGPDPPQEAPLESTVQDVYNAILSFTDSGAPASLNSSAYAANAGFVMGPDSP